MKGLVMAIKLNQEGLKWAQNRIKKGEVDSFPGSWKAHKASKDETDKYLETHDIHEYGQWFLGLNTEVPENSKQHYVFPHGDLKMVHTDALEEDIKAAQAQGIKEVADAAQRLLDMVDKTEH